MYTPTDGVETHWVMQNGERRQGQPKTFFKNNGPNKGASLTYTLERYGDPRSEEEKAGGLTTLSAYRFPYFPEKGVLPGSIRTAWEDPKNPWNITLETDDLRMSQQINDVAATIADEVIKRYPASGEVGDWPVKVGDSTDPNNRTERKILGPYGDFEKTVGGKTYYYKNTRLNRPRDPWYLSPTESRNMNPVVSSTMGQGSEVGGQNPTGEKLSTGVKLIIANYSRDLPGEGEGGRYAAKLKSLVRELKSLMGMS